MKSYFLGLVIGMVSGVLFSFGFQPGCKVTTDVCNTVVEWWNAPPANMSELATKLAECLDDPEGWQDGHDSIYYASAKNKNLKLKIEKLSEYFPSNSGVNLDSKDCTTLLKGEEIRYLRGKA